MSKKIEELHERLKENMNKAVRLANNNTARNADGHVVLKVDDEWRKEEEEEE